MNEELNALLESIKIFCTILSTLTAIIGMILVIVQIKKGTRAQQDKKAPLLILEYTSIADIKIKNEGELPAKNVKINYLAHVIDGGVSRIVKKKSLFPVSINNGESKMLFQLDGLAFQGAIKKIKIKIKYFSPLKDRKRKYKNLIMNGGNV